MSISCKLSSLPLSEVYKSAIDPRSGQGKLYPLPFLLNCAQSAILSGAKGFRQIGEWIEAQSFKKLFLMGNRYRRKPDESTLRKCFKRMNIQSFQDICYLWADAKDSEDHDYEAIAVDGKTLRASRNSDNRQPHMLSAISHKSGILLGDLLVPNKRSEVQFIQPLLDTIKIKGKVVTADALHTINSFGKYIVARESDYVFIAKGNKKKLIDRLKMLDIRNTHNSCHETKGKSHGRLEMRRLFLLADLPFWLAFSSAKQAFIIERERVNVKSGKRESEIHFGLTSLLPSQADARKILEITRGHWAIENRAFHVRDRTLHEDQSTVRAGILPEIMVLFRNMALNIFRINGFSNIAKAIRKCNLYPGEELKLMGIS